MALACLLLISFAIECNRMLSRFPTTRHATLSDISPMIRLERRCPAAAHWTEEQYRQIFVSDDSAPRRLALVAEAPQLMNEPSVLREEPDLAVLAGFLVARGLASEWELENIVVAPEMHRNGIGRRLLEMLLASARQENGRTILLEVRESNFPARQLYERAGFEETGRRRHYYANPSEDAILYRHALG